jgi:sugar phosphate isomerase/epimerase
VAIDVILCSSGVFFERDRSDAESILDFGPRLPIDGVEVLAVGRMIPIFDETAERLRDSGLKFPVVHAPKPVGARLPSTDAITELENTAVFARTIGADLIVMHLWDMPDSDRDMDGRLDAAVLAADIAEAHGIEIAMETIPCTHASPLRNLERVLKHEPRVRIALDTEFLALHNELNESVDAPWLWERDIIRHIHLKDYNDGLLDETGKRRYLAAGAGAIDFPSFFERLNERGFSGSMSLEAAPKTNGRLDLGALKQLLARISHEPWSFA